MAKQKFNYFYLAIVSIAGAYFLKQSFFPADWIFLENVDLIMHEAGHIIFFVFGQFIYVLGGTLAQILLPLLFVIYFFRQNQKLSASLTMFWLGQNFLNISVYAADAVKMNLPLITGDSSGHDWHYLLSTLGLLKYTEIIGGFFWLVGLLIIVMAIILGYNFSLKNFVNRNS
jgi:hypothetical protein